MSTGTRSPWARSGQGSALFFRDVRDGDPIPRECFHPLVGYNVPALLAWYCPVLSVAEAVALADLIPAGTVVGSAGLRWAIESRWPLCGHDDCRRVLGMASDCWATNPAPAHRP